MVPVSFVLFAHQATGSFGTASLVLAAYTAGRLALSPHRGRMLDRLGPSASLIRLVAPATVTDVVFILAGREHPSSVVLITVAAASGAVTAPAITAVRGIWASLTPDPVLRRTSFALMAVSAEITFFTGPLLAGVLIAAGSPTLAVAASAVLSAGGTLALALAPAARAITPHPEGGRGGWLAAFAAPGVRSIVAAAGLFGVTFGVLDVAWPAFARSQGATAAAGLFLSLFALGAGIGGLLYGTLKHRRSAVSLYSPLCLLAAVGLVPLLLADTTAAMSVCAVLSGLCFAPVSNVQTAAVDELSPAARRGETYTWIGTLYGSGSALGAALAGQLIVHSGERAAFAAACAGAALAWVVSFTGGRR
jgi:MFS family permease